MTPSHLDSTFARFRESGDPALLGRVFDEVAPGLLSLARRMAPDAASAEDLVQETFLTALERADAWDASRPVGPWLAGILANRARAARRRAARGPQPSEVAPSTEEGPDAALAGAELERAVDRAVGELPSRERAAVAARLFDGLSGPELAERFGISRVAARARLSRGMRRLREALPAGLSLGAAPVVGPLARVRRAVLESAGAPEAAMPAGGSTLAAAAVLVIGAVGSLGAAAYLWRVDSGPSELEPLDTELARREADSGAGGGESSEELTAAERVAIDVTPADAAAATRPWRVRVVDGESGEPLAGIPVEAGVRRNGEYTGPVIQTDAEGLAVFALDSDLSRIRWTAGPTDEVGMALRWSNDDSETEITLEVSVGGELSGRVVDMEGNPLPGARVLGWCGLAREGPAHRSARAGADGRFTLKNLGPDFNVSASADGHAVVDALLGSLEPREVAGGFEVRMDRAVSLEGQVVDRGGSPLEGVSVTAQPGRSWGMSGDMTHHPEVTLVRGDVARTETGTDGRFRFDSVPASVSTSVRAELAPYLIFQEWLDPDDGPAVITLDPGQTLEGVVREADGTPAVGARVSFGPYYGNVQTTPKTFECDDDGRFRIRGIRPEDVTQSSTPLYVTVVHEGHAVEVVQPIEESRLGAGRGIEVRLTADAQVHGRLVDGAGQPIAGASLRIAGPRRFVPAADHGHTFSWELACGVDTAKTAEDGSFSFAHLHEGPHALTVNPPGQRNTRVVLDVETSDAPQEFVLEQEDIDRVILVGRVVDAVSGEPIESFTVIPLLDGSGRHRELRSEDGRFRIPGTDPRTSEVAFQARGYAEVRVSVALPESGEFALDVALHEAVALGYRIVEGDGAPADRAGELRFEALDGTPLFARTSSSRRSSVVRTPSSGEGTVHGLPALPLRVHVTYGRMTKDFVVDLGVPAAREQVFQVAEMPPAQSGELALFLRASGQGRASDVERMMARGMAGEEISQEEREALFAALDPPRLPLRVEMVHESGFDRASVTFTESGPLGVHVEVRTSSQSGPGTSTGSMWEEDAPFAAAQVTLPSGPWSVRVLCNGAMLYEGRCSIRPRTSRDEITPLIIDL